MCRYYRLSTGVLIDRLVPSIYASIIGHSCIHAIRLINRGLYPLAMEICKYLKIPPANGEVKILKEWALRKVRALWYYIQCQRRRMHESLHVQCTALHVITWPEMKCCWKCTELVVIRACMSDLRCTIICTMMCLSLVPMPTCTVRLLLINSWSPRSYFIIRPV